MITHIGREAFRTAEEFLDTSLFKRRNTAHRIKQQRFKMFKAARDFVKAEIFGNPVHAPWPRIRFKRADQQLARVIFIISTIIIIAQDGERIVNSLHPFKQHIIMLASMQWGSHANTGRQVARPHATAYHDIIGINHTVRSINPSNAVAIVADFGHFGILKYFCAAGTRTFSQCLRYIYRIGIAITRNVNAANDIINVNDVGKVFDFLWRNHMDRQVEHLRHGGAAL